MAKVGENPTVFKERADDFNRKPQEEIEIPIGRARSSKTKLSDPVRREAGRKPSPPGAAVAGIKRRGVASGAGLISTAAARSKANPELWAGVKQLEAEGGRGGWLETQLPWEGSKSQLVYLMKKPPKRASIHSPIHLLRLESTLLDLSKASARGVPFVFGSTDERHQAEAAAFGEGIQLANDVILAGGVSGHKSVVFLGRTTSASTLAHELQHWDDFEDAEFQKTFDRLAKPLMEASYLSAEEKRQLLWLVWELRGHGAGERYGLRSQVEGTPMLDRNGAPIPSADLEKAHEFAAAYQANGFSKNYGPWLRHLGGKAKTASASDYQAFVSLLTELTLPGSGRLRVDKFLARD